MKTTILIIQTAFLGDVIMTTPLVRAVAETFPNAEIDMLTIPQTRIVFRDNPHVRNILVFDKRSKSKKVTAFVTALADIRRQHYDIAISTSRSMTNALLMRLAGIPTRVGFASQKMITHPVTHPRGMHMRMRYLALVQPFSKETFDAQTELFWTQKDAQSADEKLEQIKYPGRPVVGIAPGSVWETKKWPKSYYAELVKRLDAANINIVLLGAPDERALCEEIRQESTALNTAGELSITASAALIKKCDLMLANDSAPLHMANAVQTDVFAFFGPTVRRFGCYPYRTDDRIFEINNLECRPCGKHGGKKCPQKHFRCMLEITPQQVFEHVIKHVE